MNESLERFVYVMADLITKYADKIDLDELPEVDMPEVETTKVSASFIYIIHSNIRREGIM